MVEWKKIGEVCKYYRGRSLSKNDIGLGEANVILYGELYTTYGNYITSVKSKTSIEKAKTATSIQRNDLLLPVSSTTKEAQIGKASVYLGNDDVSLGSDAIILRDAPNSAYLMYYLNSSLFEKDKMSCVHGTTIMHLSPKELVDKKIPVPSFSVQQRIVEQLDTFTCSIENLKEQIAQRRKQYEYYRDQLLDLEGKPGVEMKTLGELCELVTKQTGFDYSGKIKPALLTNPQEGALPFLQTKNFSGRKFDYNTDYYVPERIVEQYPKIVLNKQCLLFSIVGASIGNIGLFPGSRRCFLGGAICVLKFLDGINIHYVYEVMSSWYGQKQIREKTKGAGQATITVEDVRKFVIPYPNSEIQTRIVSILDTFEASVANLEQQLALREKQYEYYRNKLLTFE